MSKCHIISAAFQVLQTMVLAAFFVYASLVLDVTPSDVQREVQAAEARIIKRTAELNAAIGHCVEDCEFNDRWRLETLTALDSIRDELSSKGEWMKATQDYIDKATEDRWRKTDAQKTWEAFFKANPTINRIKIENSEN